MRYAPHNRKKVYIIRKIYQRPNGKNGFEYLMGMPGQDDEYQTDYGKMHPRFTIYRHDAWPFHRFSDAANILCLLNPEQDTSWKIMRFNKITEEELPACQ